MIIKKAIKIMNEMILLFITNFPGEHGIKLRRWYWSKKFNKCGKNLTVDIGVLFQNPEMISVGDNIWIDKYCVLMAGKVDLQENTLRVKEIKAETDCVPNPGELNLGNNIHLGIFTIIQAHGGVNISDDVTTSAGVKIYSLSNMVTNIQAPDIIMYANFLNKEKSQVGYILSPIVIERGVWLALNVTLLGGIIGENSFVASNSVVVDSVPANSYVFGNPGRKIKERFSKGCR